MLVVYALTKCLLFMHQNQVPPHFHPLHHLLETGQCRLHYFWNSDFLLPNLLPLYAPHQLHQSILHRILHQLLAHRPKTMWDHT